MPYRRPLNPFRYSIKNMIQLHNRIKGSIYENVDADISMELGAGHLNDLSRWQKIKKVYAVEYDKPSLKRGMEYYEEYQGKKPDIVFINADVRNDPLWEMIPDMKGKINSIFINFSIHYFLCDKKSIDNLLSIIEYFLAENGYVIVTCLDGKKIFDILRNKSIYKIMNSNVTLFSMKKMYTQTDQLLDYGQIIKSYVISIGIPHNECLVNIEFLEKLLKEKGIILCEKISFPEYARLYNVRKDRMSSGEKNYSSLCVYLKFKKIA